MICMHAYCVPFFFDSLHFYLLNFFIYLILPEAHFVQKTTTYSIINIIEKGMGAGLGNWLKICMELNKMKTLTIFKLSEVLLETSQVKSGLSLLKLS